MKKDWLSAHLRIEIGNCVSSKLVRKNFLLQSHCCRLIGLNFFRRSFFFGNNSRKLQKKESVNYNFQFRMVSFKTWQVRSKKCKTQRNLDSSSQILESGRKAKNRNNPDKRHRYRQDEKDRRSKL